MNWMAKLMPKVGTQITFEGTPTNYTPNPFMMQLTDGKLNQPAYVRHVAEGIAALRELPVADVARHTTANFFRLFNIPQGCT